MSTYCITTKCPPPKAWYKDEALHEYPSSDLFWVMAIAIMVNCWWVAKQFEPFVEPARDPKEPDKAEKEADKVIKKPDSTESPKAPAPKHAWLKSQITSEPRRYLAMTICALVMPVQLLHGSWVLRTLWRWTAALLKATYPSIRPRLFGFILYSPVTLFILVTCEQFLCLCNINEMKLSVRSKASEKVAKQSEDDEWDEVEKNSEQGGVDKEKNSEQEEVDKEKNEARLAD
ncbi:hypothetical protein Neosp_013160 [[Neocosmospora] mangrovei]